MAEKGSFGKSTRRSRSKTATPARREDPTAAAADVVFESWKTQQANGSKSTATTPQRNSSSQPNLLAQNLDDAAVSSPVRIQHKEPTEIILRGYRSPQQQYAAINHYEELAGRICEDYARDPPIENRRYKSELRDPAFTRRGALTAEERVKVNRADGGEHWIKVTFESAQAADTAIYSSPQKILGHLVYAEPYHGIPPARDEAVPDPVTAAGELLTAARRSEDAHRYRSLHGLPPRGPPRPAQSGAATLPKSFTTSNLPGELDLSPPRSHASSRTVETGTMVTESTSETVRDGGALAAGARPRAALAPADGGGDEFCRAIKVRKAKLLSADQALLPQMSYTQRVLGKVPFLQWFSGSMIGNEVPRTDAGDFDWDRASLYWKLIWWLDSAFGLFGGEILTADKDE